MDDVSREEPSCRAGQRWPQPGNNGPDLASCGPVSFWAGVCKDTGAPPKPHQDSRPVFQEKGGQGELNFATGCGTGPLGAYPED
uniref:Uncharacterized protein n=1 Tax=Sphaerodactylus townsendi TaxID=933632 RepID=A0ACB8FUS5_9SAUR